MSDNFGERSTAFKHPNQYGYLNNGKIYLTEVSHIDVGRINKAINTHLAV